LWVEPVGSKIFGHELEPEPGPWPRPGWVRVWATREALVVRIYVASKFYFNPIKREKEILYSL
jgi:hypothetical protein